MRPIPEQAKQILAKTDEQLRQLIAAAATAGDLAGVDFAREIAGRIQQILHSIDSKGPGKAITPAAPAASRAKGPKRKARKKKSAYPKYHSRNGALYRLGWSKKQREEYEHKAPKSVLDQTVAALVKLGRSAPGPLTAEAVISEINGSAKASIPSYQIYVVIGFLRESGCIQQVGREGYQVPPDLSAKGAAVWKQLLESKGQPGD